MSDLLARLGVYLNQLRPQVRALQSRALLEECRTEIIALRAENEALKKPTMEATLNKYGYSFYADMEGRN